MPTSRLNFVHRPADHAPIRLSVVCLCAEWCGTCRGYQEMLAAEARRFGDTAVLWLDVEADAELVGDELDIETFPTLLVMDAEARVYFFGPVLPGIGALERLLKALHENGQQPVPVGDDVQSLAERLISLMGVDKP